MSGDNPINGFNVNQSVWYYDDGNPVVGTLLKFIVKGKKKIARIKLENGLSVDIDTQNTPVDIGLPPPPPPPPPAVTLSAARVGYIPKANKSETSISQSLSSSSSSRPLSSSSSSSSSLKSIPKLNIDSNKKKDFENMDSSSSASSASASKSQNPFLTGDTPKQFSSFDKSPYHSSSSSSSIQPISESEYEMTDPELFATEKYPRIKRGIEELGETKVEQMLQEGEDSNKRDRFGHKQKTDKRKNEFNKTQTR